MELIKANLFRLCQLDQVLYALRADEYSKPLTTLLGASLGQHFRHIAENYMLLLERANDEINYDLRARKKEWETDPNSMRSALNYIQGKIEEITADTPLQWKGSLSVENETVSEANSSLFRELAYNMEHCVHHMAIIRIAWTQLRPNEPIDPTFGMAAATIRFQNERISA